MRTDTHANENRMPCAAIPMEDLKAHLDGELSGMRRYFVGKHLARCASCREEVEGLRQFGTEMRDLETAVPSPQLRQRIMANLPEMAPVPPAPVRWKSNPMPRYAMAGAFSLLLAVGVFALNRTLNAPSVPTTAQTGNREQGTGDRTLPPDPMTYRPNDLITQSPNDPIVKVTLPKVTVPPDDLSMEADRIVAAQEKARVQQERKAWQRWVRQTPELRQTPTSHTMPERVSLTVYNDAESAVETLREKVAALGGKLYMVSKGTEKGGVFSNTSSEQLYAVKIPITQLSGLAEALHKTGEMQAATAGKLPLIYHKNGIVSTDITKPTEDTHRRIDTKETPPVTVKNHSAPAPKAKTVFVLVAFRNP